MRIGYGRVSTRDQHPEAQHDALTAAGCEQIFLDKASGKLASRPELSKALLVANRPEDQLVVTKLDRLGRSLEHLIELSKTLQDRGVDLVVLDQGIDTSTAVGRMFFQILGAIAEFEHALMSERTRDGLAAARARGRTGGQKPKLGPRQVDLARQMYDERGKRRYTVEQIAAEFGVTRPPFTGISPLPQRKWRRDCGRVGRTDRRGSSAGDEPLRGTAASYRGRGSTDPRGGTGGRAARTAQRWLQRYRTAGLAGLAPARRRATGRRTDPELVRLIEGMALHRPCPSLATITRRAARVAAAQGWKPVSYNTVRSIVTAIDPAMTTLAHDGAAAFRDTCELVYRRRADHPNAMWQVDHTQLDILIDDSGTAKRPWLTAVLDDCSRAVPGYTVTLGAPSALNTSLALRQAIWTKPDPTWPMCGIPEILYVDHGGDFVSDHLAQVAADLKFQIVHSAVPRPQGRGKVERFFGSINTELLTELPGHLVGGKPVTPPALSLRQLDEAIGAFITTYHRRVHSEIGVTPQDCWVGHGWLPRLPEALEQLDLLLVRVAAARVVHRDGLHFQGLRYLHPALAAYVRESVTIRYDPRDITEIRVFHKNRFLCKAVSPDHTGDTIGLKDIQAARRAYRRRIRDQINERIAVVTDYLPAPDCPPVPSKPAKPPPAPPLRAYRED